MYLLLQKVPFDDGHMRSLLIRLDLQTVPVCFAFAITVFHHIADGLTMAFYIPYVVFSTTERLGICLCRSPRTFQAAEALGFRSTVAPSKCFPWQIGTAETPSSSDPTPCPLQGGGAVEGFDVLCLDWLGSCLSPRNHQHSPLTFEKIDAQPFLTNFCN